MYKSIDELYKLKTPEDWGKHQFKAGLFSPYTWANIAEQHFLVSRTLLLECCNSQHRMKTEYNNVTGFAYGTQEFETLQKTYFDSPSTFFLALSFENFLKGAWVKTNYESIKNNNTFPGFLNTHDLKQIANDCRITISKKEDTLLNSLTQYLYWFGKYRIPKKEEALTNFFKHKNILTFSKLSPTTSGFPIYVEKLREKIISIIFSGL